MAIKIVSLKSGEYVVTELQEAVDDKQRRQAFVFNNPHCVKTVSYTHLTLPTISVV